jgi:hypothetical protein
MGTTTFTGPIKAGDVLNTTGTTVGSIKNVGFVVMAQSAVVNQATNVGSAGVYKTNIVIPAGSQILTVAVLKTAAWSGVAQTITSDENIFNNDSNFVDKSRFIISPYAVKV